jgi:exonuclease 3'-5' domain-containing protein 2
MPVNVAQNQIYESYSMLHPDGTLMCHCNFKRAKWYVDRDLATWVDEKQFKLKFEPQGYGKSENPFYMQALENRCVVCGSLDELNKHHVVPYVFRSRFPLAYKESNHHDIVPVCVDCHERYEAHATEFKALLAHQAGANMNTSMTEAFRHNKKVLSARNILQRIKEGNLVDSKGNPAIVPEEKLMVLREKAREELREDVPVSGTQWADSIMDKVMAEEGLFAFVKQWRAHFIEHMKPQYLPQYWSVEHPLEVKGKEASNEVVQ